MEEKRLLDACLKTVAVMVLLTSLASCSLPRILVLHDPLTPEEHITLGVSYEKKSEFDAALKEYKEASGNLPLAYLYMGNVYFQMKDYPHAEKYYKKAINKTQSADAYNNLAWLLYTNNERLDEAEALALKAVELSPHNEGFADTLRKIEEKLGRR
jgi:tetratricopeptide (TPR) repeat protein